MKGANDAKLKLARNDTSLWLILLDLDACLTSICKEGVQPFIKYYYSIEYLHLQIQGPRKEPKDQRDYRNAMQPPLCIESQSALMPVATVMPNPSVELHHAGSLQPSKIIRCWSCRVGRWKSCNRKIDWSQPSLENVWEKEGERGVTRQRATRDVLPLLRPSGSGAYVAFSEWNSSLVARINTFALTPATTASPSHSKQGGK